MSAYEDREKVGFPAGPRTPSAISGLTAAEWAAQVSPDGGIEWWECLPLDDGGPGTLVPDDGQEHACDYCGHGGGYCVGETYRGDRVIFDDEGVRVESCRSCDFPMDVAL